jgi:hypothetical protein
MRQAERRHPRRCHGAIGTLPDTAAAFAGACLASLGAAHRHAAAIASARGQSGLIQHALELRDHACGGERDAGPVRQGNQRVRWWDKLRRCSARAYDMVVTDGIRLSELDASPWLLRIATGSVRPATIQAAGSHAA